jgi:DNA-binding CsgD family transcriptional regulator
MKSLSIQMQQPLALATSQIHRSRTLEELQLTFLNVAPKFVNADAFGVYLFDDNLETKTVNSHQANHNFLSEYEKIRAEDPLFRFILQKKKFTHSLDIFDQRDWLQQPLHSFLSRWGLNYSIEAPLIHDGHISGTLNFAIGGSHYFGKDSLDAARFLCDEINATYKRILDFSKLKNEVQRFNQSTKPAKDLSKRAQEVLELLKTGLNNSAISEHLNISENTVRYHIKQIYKVFAVHNRAQLLKYVFSNMSSSEQQH